MHRPIGTFLLAAISCSAQQEPTFRAGSDLVQVSVVAQDGNGKAVADLRREDFQIFDNGAQQEIRLFLLQSSGPAETEVNARGIFTNRPVTDKTVAHSVFLFDNLNIVGENATFEHTARARIRALAALRALPPGDEIAIYALWCQFQVVHGWTADRDSLLAQLGKFSPAPAGCRKPEDEKLKRATTFVYPRDSGSGQSALSRYNVAPVTAEFQMGMPPAAPNLHSLELQRLEEVGITKMMYENTNVQISQLADYLAGIPGRKNLIWLSTTFALKPSTVRKLIDADVALYPVDTLGSTIRLKYAKDERAAQLREFATATGGIPYTERDDLDVAIAEAMNDGRTSYILGFYPPASDRDVSVHGIGIRLNRPGVTLRYRTTYAPETPRRESTNPARDVVLAMNRAVDATAIGITASAAHDGPSHLHLSVAFDISNLNLELAHGQWTGKEEIVTRFVTADDKQAGSVVAQTVTFNLKPATYASMLQRGYLYREQLTIPPKAADLNLAISNLATGKIGTIRIPLSEIK